MTVAPFLEQIVLPFLKSPSMPCGAILDLACGSGQNGLFLAEHGFPVELVDRDADKVNKAGQTAKAHGWPVTTRIADLESGPPVSFAPESYAAVMVFRYLHRPLFPALLAAVKPGGLLVYESFTEDHGEVIGKPSNPNFLLRRGELRTRVPGWEILHSFEGRLDRPERYVARLIARKPGH
jgi:SAM-dependent methyltransferase